ncbi:MAG TPA: hypothetical protein VL527_00065 [Dongiaceae bacterium]|nr:hypothetical protein [Dongiaceae bacterium]
MTQLHQQVCLHHAGREAVARCPQCGQFFCRECITEHDDRVICAACLRKLLRPEASRRRSFAGFTRATAFLLGLMLAWTAFYWVGRILLTIPTAFHNGTLWQGNFWDE